MIHEKREWRKRACKPALIFVIFCIVWLQCRALSAEDNRNPTVGAAGWVEQVKLPGSELIAKPLDEQAPIVVRIVKVFPHGDSFRYDLRFHGLEPGEYDLSQWLLRKDGSSTDDLPEIRVEVLSLLPPGQIQPNELELGWLPRLGGYRRVAIVVGVLWGVVLLGLIFYKRKKPEVVDEQVKLRSLADLLHERLESAAANEMAPKQYAELERMLIAFWRKRLGLESMSVDQAIHKLHADEGAGPLLKQIEEWMHSPSPKQDVDLKKLVEPFRDLPADTPGFEE